MKVVVLGGVPTSLINFRGNLLRALSQQGHEVIACSTPAPPDIVETLGMLGAKFKPIPVERAGLNPFSDLKLCFAIVNLIKTERPNVILAYTAKPVIFGGIAARLTGTGNFYAMITGLGYAFGLQTFKQRFIGFLVRLLYRIALTESKRVFFQNPDDEIFFYKYKLISTRANAVRINGSGVDLDQFQPTKLPSKPIFSLLARLLADKGLREFYTAAKFLKQKYPHARFLLAGSLDVNPMSVKKEELKGWIDEGVIEYRGSLQDVRPFFSETMVYVLPSYREGTPRSVLEAMAMGRPIITTDAPGCRETVIDSENGFLVPVKSVEALVAAMERFIKEPDLAARMGKRSREIAEERYDVHKVNAVMIREMGL